MNQRMMIGSAVAILVAIAAAGLWLERDGFRKGAEAPPAAAQVQAGDGVEPYACGTVERLHTWKSLFLGSQPAPADLRHAKENGIKAVLNLRPESEQPEFDEAALVAELGMEYHNVPFASPVELTDEVFESARALLRDDAKRPMFVHCHSGNRVGAIWLAYVVLDENWTWDAAVEAAHKIGLRSPALEERVREYVLGVRGLKAI